MNTLYILIVIILLNPTHANFDNAIKLNGHPIIVDTDIISQEACEKELAFIDAAKPIKDGRVTVIKAQCVAVEWDPKAKGL